MTGGRIDAEKLRWLLERLAGAEEATFQAREVRGREPPGGEGAGGEGRGR